MTKSEMSGLQFIQIDETPSTNNYASSLLASGKVTKSAVVLTFRQTNGKGYGTNVWESEDFKNLTFSLILFPGFLPASKQFLLSQVVSLGLTGYLLSETTGAEIKWPNDILIDRKKVAGILIDNRISGSDLISTIIGIGINMNQQNFPGHLSQATSLSLSTNKQYNLETALEKIVAEIMKWYRLLQKGEHELIREKYLENLAGLGKITTFRRQNEVFKAEITGIDPYGQLLLKHRTGEVMAYPFKSVEMVY